MQATMEDMARNAQRVDLAGDESDFQMISCRLSRAQILQSDSETPAGSCLLHVSYEVQERYTILDCHSEQPLPPFDGSAREQKSTWVFSGVVTPPSGGEASGKGEGEDGGRGGGARDEVGDLSPAYKDPAARAPKAGVVIVWDPDHLQAKRDGKGEVVIEEVERGRVR